MTDDRLPTALWVDAHLRPLDGQGKYYYITQKGEQNSGIVLLKLANTRGKCRLLIQQRNFETNELGWVNALNEDMPEEPKADEYIRRAISRDPDLWVVEIEDPEMENPFSPATATPNL